MNGVLEHVPYAIPPVPYSLILYVEFYLFLSHFLNEETKAPRG